MSQRRSKTRKYMTLMVVPHSEHAIMSLRIPFSVLQVGASLLTVFWVCILVLVNSYFAAAAHMGELEELRWVNREQRAQIDILVREADDLQQRLVYLAELDRQLREMAELADTPSSTPLPRREDLLTSLDRVAAAEGQAAEGSTSPVHFAAGLVDRSALRDAALVRDRLEEMQQNIAPLQSSLESLRAALAERQAYIAARPSVWPVVGLITSGYGYRASPFGRGRDLHEGLDIAAPYGSPVITTGDGKITFVGWRASYGKSVVIDHGFGFTTLYGHNSRITVTVGQSVKKRQIIAYVGTSGRSTGPHLHYEVRLNGRLVDPRRYLSHATF